MIFLQYSDIAFNSLPLQNSVKPFRKKQNKFNENLISKEEFFKDAVLQYLHKEAGGSLTEE